MELRGGENRVFKHFLAFFSHFKGPEEEGVVLASGREIMVSIGISIGVRYILLDAFVEIGASRPAGAVACAGAARQAALPARPTARPGCTAPPATGYSGATSPPA